MFTIANHAAAGRTSTTIPAGSTSFRATIGSPSDAAADLDLFVYQCTDPHVRAGGGPSADGDSEESVTIANPAAGTWQVLIDGFASRRDDDVQLRRRLRQPGVRLGRGHRRARAAPGGGSSWTAPGSVTAGAVPEAGRVLLGAVNVVTDGGFNVGSKTSSWSTSRRNNAAGSKRKGPPSGGPFACLACRIFRADLLCGGQQSSFPWGTGGAEGGVFLKGLSDSDSRGRGAGLRAARRSRAHARARVVEHAAREQRALERARGRARADRRLRVPPADLAGGARTCSSSRPAS